MIARVFTDAIGTTIFSARKSAPRHHLGRSGTMTTFLEEPIAAAPSSTALRARVPGYLAATALASTSVIVGLLWDISWHRTIGRDRFLTPAHLAIYLGGLVGGLASGARVLKTTFAGCPEERAASVGFWGLRGPLGAWLCIWGSFAMLTSAPFDNWWHNAYGLDVEILSPPHTVLGLGMIAIEMGAMLLVLAHQNRAGGASSALGWLYVYCAGIALLMAATIAWEYTGFPNMMHSALFYKVSAAAFPLFMIGPARAAAIRSPVTAIAAVYTGLTLAMMWILQLFPATPLLGPIYNPVGHMQPPTFPLLLVVPAVALDLLLERLGGRSKWRLAAALGVTFVLSLLVVQWFFAEFLLSPAARNFVFAADHWNYGSRLGPWRYEYWNLDRDGAGRWSGARFALGIVWAMAVATVTSRVGLGWGAWMARVRR